MEILIFAVCGFMGSLFYVLSTQESETIMIVLISAGLGTTLSLGIALIFYDFTNKRMATMGIALITGSLGHQYSSLIGKKLMNKLLNNKKK